MLTLVIINKKAVKTGGGRAWITIISPLHSLTNKWSRGRREGGMDNDYLTPVFINKQVVGREYCMGLPGAHLVYFCCCMKY